MPNRLNIPSELNSLVEKREGDDRRQGSEEVAAQIDGATENSNKSCAGRKQRSGKDRRENPSADS